jgi:hypothetical protein
VPIHTPYVKTQNFTDGKIIREVVADSTLHVSLETEFSAIATASSNIPAIHTTSTLQLLGALDLDGNHITGVSNLNSILFFVDEYGATGDGAADDRAAFISAIDAATAAGGGIVVLGPKTYSIQSTIASADLTSGFDGVTIVGCGWSTVIDKETGGAGHLFDLTADTDVHFRNIKFVADSGETGGYFITDFGDNCSFTNLWFVGAGTQDGAIRTLSATAPTNCSVDGLKATGAYDEVVCEFDTVVDSTISGINAVLDASTPGHGVRFDNCGGTSASNISVNRTVGNTSASGITCEGNGVFGNFTLTGANVVVGGAAQHGISISGDGVVLHGFTISIEDDADTCIGLVVSGDNSKISSGLIRGNGSNCEGSAIQPDGATHCFFTGIYVEEFNDASAGGELWTAGASCTECMSVGVYSNNMRVVTTATGMRRDAGTVGYPNWDF